MNDKWIKDIMTQKFIDSDIGRLIMLRAFVKDGKIYSSYRKKEIAEYMYRVYSDYKEIREINPDIKIRYINRYGISDMKYIIDNALEQWKENATNDVLVWDERYIYLKDVENEDQSLAKVTIQVCEMLQKKYFTVELKEPINLNYIDFIEDQNLDVFGKSIYRDRVFEDVQYCPLCEEINREKLYVVHILPAEFCEEEEIVDKNNGIILCKEHAKDYMTRKFWFKENGFVSNNGSVIVNEKMHLSIQIKNRERRKLCLSSL